MPNAELIADLRSENPKQKASAARKLGELGDQDAVPHLITALPEGGEARQDIIWALGRIGDSRASGTLIPVLHDENWHLRAAAAEALGLIQEGEGVVDALIQALADANDSVHWKAAWALGEIGDRKASTPLLSGLSDTNSPRCWQSAWALGKLGESKAVKPILSLLVHPDVVVRRHALMALKMIGDPDSAGAILPLLDDPNGEIRHYATETLISLGKNIVLFLEEQSGKTPADLQKKIRWIVEHIEEAEDDE